MSLGIGAMETSARPVQPSLGFGTGGAPADCSFLTGVPVGSASLTVATFRALELALHLGTWGGLDGDPLSPAQACCLLGVGVGISCSYWKFLSFYHESSQLQTTFQGHQPGLISLQPFRCHMPMEVLPCSTQGCVCSVGRAMAWRDMVPGVTLFLQGVIYKVPGPWGIRWLDGFAWLALWREENSVTPACGSIPTTGAAAWPALSCA